MQSGATKTCQAARATAPGAGQAAKLLDGPREALRARRDRRRDRRRGEQTYIRLGDGWLGR